MVELSTDYLRKNLTGVLSGTNSDKKNSCLSQLIITDFIDDYFDGKILVDIKDNIVNNISVKLVKIDIDDKFIEKYFSKIESEIIIEELEITDDFIDIEGDAIEFEVDAMEDISNDEKIVILGDTFSALVSLYDGSLVCYVYTDHLEFISI